VVQQGMNQRADWRAATLAFGGGSDFTSQPHTAIVGEHQGTIMNLVDSQRGGATGHAGDCPTSPTRLSGSCGSWWRRRIMTCVRGRDPKRLGAVLAAAYEREFRGFRVASADGKPRPRTLQSLALIAEVVHGASTRFSDRRDSHSLGGKDRHPFRCR